MYVVSAQQMRDIDRFTIQQIGIPSLVLMENAGVAVVKEVEKRWPSGKVVIVAGPGNNGGDGLVIARHLKTSGRDVRVWLFGNDDKLSKDCTCQLQIMKACQYEVIRYEEEAEGQLSDDLRKADIRIEMSKEQ